MTRMASTSCWTTLLATATLSSISSHSQVEVEYFGVCPPVLADVIFFYAAVDLAKLRKRHGPSRVSLVVIFVLLERRSLYGSQWSSSKGYLWRP